ncbi:hypothetical protein GIB67_024433 [Kingdonia uniflora]|uniref:Uncharacterized protein n=1 Tax=Kingdonia uniflora TaxID=39325 RepID=A0A7J7P4Q6_9MAGN|nr:hypothetical protein GIB67_024433 [Kingdonia uniflora]
MRKLTMRIFTVLIGIPMMKNLILKAPTAASSADNSVRMFDCRNLTSGGVGSPIYKIEGQKAVVLCVQWSPDKAIVFGSSIEDGLLNGWDYKKVGKKKEHVGPRMPNSPPGLFFQHAVHSYKDKVADFHWKTFDPWTIISVSEDSESTGGGETLQEIEEIKNDGNDGGEDEGDVEEAPVESFHKKRLRLYRARYHANPVITITLYGWDLHDYVALGVLVYIGQIRLDMNVSFSNLVKKVLNFFDVAPYQMNGTFYEMMWVADMFNRELSTSAPGYIPLKPNYLETVLLEEDVRVNIIFTELEIPRVRVSNKESKLKGVAVEMRK